RISETCREHGENGRNLGNISDGLDLPRRRANAMVSQSTGAASAAIRISGCSSACITRRGRVVIGETPFWHRRGEGPGRTIQAAARSGQSVRRFVPAILLARELGK